MKNKFEKFYSINSTLKDDIYNFNNKPVPKLTVLDVIEMILSSDELKDKLSNVDYSITSDLAICKMEIASSSLNFYGWLNLGNNEGAVLRIMVCTDKVVGFRVLNSDKEAFDELALLYSAIIVKWNDIKRKYFTLFNRNGYEVWTYNNQKRQSLTFFAEYEEELKQLLSEEDFKSKMASYETYRVVNLDTLTTVKIN